MFGEYVNQEQSGETLGVDLIGCRDEDPELREAVDDDEDRGITV